MRRELLEGVELQRVGRVLAFQCDDGAEGAEFGLGELVLSCLVDTGERRLQLAQTPTTVSGAVLDGLDLRVRSTPATELLVCCSIFYKKVAEVFVSLSHRSPPAANAALRGYRLRSRACRRRG